MIVLKHPREFVASNGKQRIYFKVLGSSICIQTDKERDDFVFNTSSLDMVTAIASLMLEAVAHAKKLMKEKEVKG